LPHMNEFMPYLSHSVSVTTLQNYYAVTIMLVSKFRYQHLTPFDDTIFVANSTLINQPDQGLIRPELFDSEFFQVDNLRYAYMGAQASSCVM